MRICFLSVDIERDLGGESFEGVENLGKLLAIFKKNGSHATLFITGEVLERYQEKFQQYDRDGWEIASHSFSHRFWNTLSNEEKRKELNSLQSMMEEVLGFKAIGFRAPSHLIDQEGIELLEQNEFLYDASVVPDYPFFKKYRGYQGRAPKVPYQPSAKDYRQKGEMKIWEIPCTGLLFGIPLSGTWIRKLPLAIYYLLLMINQPKFLALSFHSWDCLDEKTLQKAEKMMRLLRKKKYRFLTGKEIYDLETQAA